MGQSQSKNAETRTETSLIATDDDEPGIRGSRSQYTSKTVAARPVRAGPSRMSSAKGRVKQSVLDLEIMSTTNFVGATGPFSSRSSPNCPASPPSSNSSQIANTLDTFLGKQASSASLDTSLVHGTVTKADEFAAVTSLQSMNPRIDPRRIPSPGDRPNEESAPQQQPGSLETVGSLTSQSASSGCSPLTSPDNSDDEVSPRPSQTDALARALAQSRALAVETEKSEPPTAEQLPLPPQSRSQSQLHVPEPDLEATPEAVARTKFAAGLPLNRFIKRICVAGIQHNKAFCLSVDEIKDICLAASQLMLSQPVLLNLATPVKVVGDTHGQFQDLMRIFRMSGMPPKTNYLFLGDYVDRGKQSLETIMLLLCLKLRFPSNIFMLRGNHECANVTKVYGFYDECKRRSSLKAWRAIIDVFNTLPIAATIGGKIFCVHGGLSPSLASLDQIEGISRPTDIPDTGLVSDLLWSDPDPQVKEWADNDRGVSYCFGKRALTRFCNEFNFDLVARGHMVVEDGYEFFGGRKLVTVFSAPNYCGDFDNWGAVMSVDKDLLCSFELLQPTVKRRHAY